jgi:proteasome assembly chaperone (PAC2) family protein
MDYLQIDELPTLRSPTLVAAFRGWNDAGESATLAVRHLIERWSAAPFASIDPEEFYDFTVARPMIRVNEDGLRDLKWPSNRFYAHEAPEAEGDVVLFLGTEPHLRWRTFIGQIREVYDRLGGARLVTLGALVAEAAHTRPPPVTGFSTEDALQRRIESLTITRSKYEGPTGIVGTLHDAWRRAGLPAASLWAGLPPYLGQTVNPKGALALLERLDWLFAFGIDFEELNEASRQFEEQVNEALSDNIELRAYVQEMERRMDSGVEEASAPDLPPAKDVISELEEFLRRQGKGG